MTASKPLLDAISRYDKIKMDQPTVALAINYPLDKDDAVTFTLSNCTIVHSCTLCMSSALTWLLSLVFRLDLCMCQELDESELEESRRRRREASSRDDDE